MTVRVYLVGGGSIRGEEALQDVVNDLTAEGARLVRLTDPGDEHLKVVPVERVSYVEEEEDD